MIKLKENNFCIENIIANIACKILFMKPRSPSEGIIFQSDSEHFEVKVEDNTKGILKEITLTQTRLMVIIRVVG